MRREREEDGERRGGREMRRERGSDEEGERRGGREMRRERDEEGGR